MQFEHLAEQAAFRLEFGGGACFGDVTVVQHNDLVGVCDSAHAVCDDDDGLALHQLRNAALDLGFVFHVEACGRFVKQDDGRVFQQGACNRDSLAFAARERVAVFADNGVVTLRHFLHEFVAASEFCHLQDFFVAGVALADADVVLDARVEQHHILEDNGEVLEERFRIDFTDILAAER